MKQKQKSGGVGDGQVGKCVVGTGKAGPAAKGGASVVQSQHGRHSMSTVPQKSGTMRMGGGGAGTMRSGSRGDKGGRGQGPASGKGTGYASSSPNPKNPYRKG